LITGCLQSEKKINKKNNRDKIKILFVIPRLSMGGEERIVTDIIKYINQDKFKIWLCLFEKRGELLSKVPADVPIFDLQKKSRWSFFLLAIKLRSIIKEYKPDIIFSALWYSTFISVFSNFVFKLKPFYLIAHEPHDHKWDIRGKLFQKTKSILINWSHRKADLVVTISKGSAYDIAKDYFLEEDKIKIINNSIDLEFIEKSKLEKVSHPWFKDGIPVVITLGRLIPRKGFSDLLEAFKLVRNQLLAHLIFIGEGESRFELQKLANELGLKDDVLFLGYQNNPFKFIYRSNVFVFPSHWEGFGNVIIEAMACGVPVISTNCHSGPDEIINDGVNGIIVPVGDVKAISEATLKLLINKELATSLAVAGRRRAEDFRVDKILEEYDKLFEDCKIH